MRLRDLPSSQQACILGLTYYTVGFFVLWRLPLPIPLEMHMQWFGLYQLVAPEVAGVAGVVVALRLMPRGRERIGWLILWSGTLAWAAGQIAWCAYVLTGIHDIPVPSWADVGFVAAYPLMIGGVFVLLSSARGPGFLRIVLDSAITASSAAILSWHFIVERVWQQSHVSLLGKYVNIVPPLGDIVLLFGALTLYRAASGDPSRRRAKGMLSLALALTAVADSGYLLYTLHPGLPRWSDAAWAFAWGLLAYVAVRPIWHRPSSATEVHSSATPPGLARILAPYAAAFGAIAVVAYDDIARRGALDTDTFLTGAVLVLLVSARQAATLLENHRLAQQLHQFNTNLESIVALRTQQLEALQRLTACVNETLDLDEVLAAAREQTKTALRADEVLLDCSSSACTASLYPACLRNGASCMDCDSVVLAAPIRTKDRRIGAIQVCRHDPFDASDLRLLESIGSAIGTAVEQAQLYAEARRAADREPLTELLNHRAIHDVLARQLDEAEQTGEPLSIVLMDLENFRLFNETWGHPTGDMLLRRVSRTLEETLGECGALGRHGGDDFLAVLPRCDSGEAMRVAQLLRAAVDADPFRPAGDDRRVPVSICVGVVSYPADATTKHDLMLLADANVAQARSVESRVSATSERQRANRALRGESSFSVLDGMITAIDNKDSYTRSHSEDVTEYALWIAEEMGLSDDTSRILRIGGLLHDVGKIGVPDEILRKPGRLTAEEYEVLKRHPQLGALIVSGVPGMEPILDAVRFHHERWDGNGYPLGLSGAEIPLLGRVMAVADAVSAMTTDRPYRKGLDWAATLREVRINSGTQFDPDCAAAFLAAAARRGLDQPRQLPLAA